MNLRQLIITWLIFGLIGIILDLTDKKNRNEYKGMNLFTAFGMFVLFLIGGGLTFTMALSDFTKTK